VPWAESVAPAAISSAEVITWQTTTPTSVSIRAAGGWAGLRPLSTVADCC